MKKLEAKMKRLEDIEKETQKTRGRVNFLKGQKKAERKNKDKSRLFMIEAPY